MEMLAWYAAVMLRLLVHSAVALLVSINDQLCRQVFLADGIIIIVTTAGAGTNTTAPATAAAVKKGRSVEEHSEKRAIRSRIIQRGLSYWI